MQNCTGVVMPEVLLGSDRKHFHSLVQKTSFNRRGETPFSRIELETNQSSGSWRTILFTRECVRNVV